MGLSKSLPPYFTQGPPDLMPGLTNKDGVAACFVTNFFACFGGFGGWDFLLVLL